MNKGFNWRDQKAANKAGLLNNINVHLMAKIINFSAFKSYLESKNAVLREDIFESGSEASPDSFFYTWLESDSALWPGSVCPTVTIKYCPKAKYLTRVNAYLPRLEGAISVQDLRERLLNELMDHGVIQKPDDEEEFET